MQIISKPSKIEKVYANSFVLYIIFQNKACSPERDK